MNAASGVPQQKQKQDGNCSRIAPNTAAGSCAAPAQTSTSRASTTFDISPTRIRSVAAAIMPLELAGRADAADLDPRGRVGIEQRQRLIAQAGETSLERGGLAPGLVAGPNHRVDGQEYVRAAATDGNLGQDQRGGRKRGPSRGATAFRVERKTTDPYGPSARRKARWLVDDPFAAKAFARYILEPVCVPREVAS